MKSHVHIQGPPMEGTTAYKCPACGLRTIAIGLIPDGMVVRRRCDCKSRGKDGAMERTTLEITSAGIRVVPVGEPDPAGMLDFRCEFCKRLLCKFIPASGGILSVKCWRNSRCMRINTLTCMNAGKKEGVA